jgi:hypothetical protein
VTNGFIESIFPVLPIRSVPPWVTDPLAAGVPPWVDVHAQSSAADAAIATTVLVILICLVATDPDPSTARLRNAVDRRHTVRSALADVKGGRRRSGPGATFLVFFSSF